MASISDYVSVFIDRIPGLQEKGMAVSNALHDVVLRYPAVRKATDILHGKQAGHPIHPILTDITLGAWLLGSAFDLVSLFHPSRHTRRAADDLITIGTISAVPTMLTGTADYSGLPQEAIKVGTLHGIFNLAGFAMYGLSVASRKKGARDVGVALSIAAMGTMVISGYLGGDLAYRLQVGVNRNKPPTEPDERWVTVMPDAALPEGKPQAVDLDGQRVLLFRRDGEVHAISAVCSHAGGPLEEGDVQLGCVECPWHQSVFNLRDGSVVHGPAVFSQPVYHVRVRSDQIEVCATPHLAVERELPALAEPA